jgi:hypothetical protein
VGYLRTELLVITLAFVFWMHPSAFAAPVVFNYSSIANPKDVINIQGQNFTENCSVWCSTNGGAPKKLSVINRGNGILHVRMPDRLGLYALSVRDGKASSAPFYPNRANPVHFDSPEISAGGSMRIFGRNLNVSGFAPQVVFERNGRSFAATIKRKSADNILLLKAPAKLALGEYNVYVTNGMGRESLSRIRMTTKILVRANGMDDLNLGVPWAANVTFARNTYNVKTDKRLSLHAIGDGKTNDQSAIENAINSASADGGGVVYLPSGTYKLASASGALMDFKSNVIVRGEGEQNTKIVYGFGKPGDNFSLARFFDASRSGLCDLAIQNLNENDAWVNSKTITNEGSHANELFLLRVTADFGSAFRIDLKGDRIVVAHCNLTSVYSLLHMGTCTNSRVVHNKLTQMLGVHLDLTQSQNCVVENNDFILNANNGKIVPGNVRHGIAIGFAHNLAILNNTWSLINGYPGSNNDGEAILSEGGGGIRTGEETGTVEKCRGNALSVKKQLPYVAGTIIAIINGKGTGQWRQIIARSGTTIRIKDSWTVDPDSSSVCSIFVWSNQNTMISGNSFTHWLRGVWTYQGSTTDTQISNNRFNEMDGVFFEPCQNVTRENGQFNPVWNTTVNDNVLGSLPPSSDGTHKQSIATYINLTGDLQQTSDLIGTMTLNNQIYHNIIYGAKATRFENDPAQTEGFCNYLRVENSHFNDSRIPAMLGAVFQRNITIGCTHAYLLNGGAYRTTIVDPVDKEVDETVLDSPRYWNTDASHKSVGTVVSKGIRTRF